LNKPGFVFGECLRARWESLASGYFITASMTGSGLADRCRWLGWAANVWRESAS